MNNIFGRLEFVHHDEVFETREQAYSYVLDKQVVERPSLVAEPMVLLYESGDAEKGPNVVLAIGSVGDGTVNTANKTFFIDTQKTEEELVALGEALEAAIKSLSVVPLESDTIVMHSEKTDDGTLVSGDVKIAEYRISGSTINENIIDVDEKGIYAFVDMDYNPETFVISFTNGKIAKEFQLPKDQHVVGGRYDYKSESIVLTLADESEVSFSVAKIIKEWTVLPDGKLYEEVDGKKYSPITLKVTDVSANTTPHEGIYDWQSVLEADVRIVSSANTSLHNILEKTADGRFLFVKGTADNIFYKNGETVADALDKVDTVSTSVGNIIYRRNDGIYATVGLTYNEAKNELTFVKSNLDGTVDENVMKLNSVKLLDDITYDHATQEIVIRYIDSNSEYQAVRVPASDIIAEWTVNNEAHNVELTKTESVPGKDILTADVKIHVGDDNILEDKNHELYVKGTADNIQFNDGRNADPITVQGKIEQIESNLGDEAERAEAAEKALDEKIDAETERATDAEKTLDEKIDTEIANEKARAEEAEKVLDEKIDDEITRSTDKDDELEKAIADEKERAEDEETRIDSKLDDEITRSTDKDEELEQAIADEKARAEEAEDALGEKIDAETERAEEAEKNLQDEIDAEAERAEKAEYDLDGKIEKEIADREADVDAEEARAKDEEKRLADILGTGFTSTDERDTVTTKFNELTQELKDTEGAFDDEVERAKEAEKTLDEKIDDEIERATDAEKTLDEKIDKLSDDRLIKVADTNSLDLEITDGEGEIGHTITGNVKISDKTDNNIEILTDGLYTTVDLAYNSETNTLTFKTNSKSTDIALVSNSLVDKVYYSHEDEAIVIEYTVNGNRMDDVIVPVRNLINEWTTDNTSTVVLNKDINTNNLPDVLTADVVISSKNDNILENDGGLYVSGSKIDANEEAINKLNEKVDDEIERSTDKDEELEGRVKDIEDTIGDGFGTNETATITYKFNELTDNLADEVDRAKTAESNLQDSIDAETERAKEAEEDLQEAIDKEVTDREDADNALTEKIDSEIAAEKERATDAEKTLDEKIDTEIANEKARAEEAEKVLDEKIDAEIERSTDKDSEHDDAIKNIETTIGTGFTSGESSNITYKFNELVETVNGIADNANDRIYEVNAKDASISVENIDKDGNVEKHATVKVNISDVHDGETVGSNGNVRTNIISLESDGLHADVDLTYNGATNTLYFSKTGSDSVTEIKLLSNSLIDGVHYDPTTESIVIDYTVNGEKKDSVVVPVHTLIQEWTVADTKTVKLTKHVNSGTTTGNVDENGNDVNYPIDVLVGEVKVSDAEKNIIEVKDDGLFVSSEKIDANAEAIAKNATDIATNATAIENVKNSLEEALETEKTTARSNEDYISGAVDTINAKLGDGFSEDPRDTVTQKIKDLEDSLNENANTKVSEVKAKDDSIVVTNSENGDSKYAEINVQLSAVKDNIIKLSEVDGIYADVNLSYDKDTNTLKFSKTGFDDIELPLNSYSLIDEIQYNAENEAIEFIYSKNGEKESVSVPLKDLIEEWEVSNSIDGAVKLTKERNVNGKDVLSAEVVIDAHHDDNILVNHEGEGLYVSGKAIAENTENIDILSGDVQTLKDNSSDLSDAINAETERAGKAEEDLDNKIEKEISDREADVDAEVTRATNAETVLDTAIATEETRATTAESTLNDKIDNEIADRKDDVNDEETRAKDEEARIEAKIDNEIADRKDDVDAEETRAKEAENALDEKIDDEIAEREQLAKDSLINVSNTNTVTLTKTDDAIGHTITADVNVSAFDDKNIIKAKGDGIYAEVGMDYNSVTNTIKFTVNGDDKEFKLSGISLLEDVAYNASTESIDIRYKVNGETSTLSVPVRDLISEWDAVSSDTIKLVKTINGGTELTEGVRHDILEAEVKISTTADNMLELGVGGLYVSNSGITANTAAINANTSRIETLENNVSEISGNVSTLSNDIASLKETVSEKTDTTEDLSDTLNALSGKVDSEIVRAMSAETALETALNNEITRSTNKDNELSEKVEALETNLSTEVTRSTQKDADLEKAIADEETRAKDAEKTIDDKLTAEIARSTKKDEDFTKILGSGFTSTDERDTVTQKFIDLEDSVNDKLSNALLGVEAEDKSVSVNTTDSIAKVKVQLSELSSNIIKLNEFDGIYADVNLAYNATENALTFSKTGSDDVVIPINGISDLKDVKYNKTTEAVDITYVKNGVDVVKSVALGDLIDEWNVSTSTEGAVKLTKTRNKADDADVLYAEVVIDAHHDDNILVNHADGGLYVSGKDIADTKTNLESEITRAKAVEAALQAKDTALEAAINAEVLRAKNAEDGVKSSVIQEKNDRISVFNELSEAISAESQTRRESDTQLRNDLTDEINRATGKENEIATNLANEIKRSTEADSAFTTSLNAEIERSTTKDTELEKAISDENVRALSAETALSTAIANEETRAKAEEARIESLINNEITRAKGAEKTIDDKLTDEIKRSTDKDTELEKAIADEIDRAKTAENALNTAITNEVTRATSAETAIETVLNAEITRSTQKDSELSGKVETLETNLNAEIARSTQKDADLTNAILAEETRAISAETTLRTVIDNESSRAIAAENSLTTAINNEIDNRKNAVDTVTGKVDDEVARAKDAESDLQTAINTEQQRAIAREDELNTAITNEITRANANYADLVEKIAAEKTERIATDSTISASVTTEVARAKQEEETLRTSLNSEITRSTQKDTDLTNAITAETEDRKNAIADVNAKIDAATLKFDDTTSIDFTKTDSGNVVTAKVKLANSDDNIITIDGEKDGVYASVKLSYNAGTNKIRLITSNGAQEEIQLNAGSIIDSMVYDTANRSLVMKYTGADGSNKEVTFPVNELFNDWVVDNPSENSAVELTKVVGTNGDADTLSARVLLTNLEDNAIKIVNNGLYVPASEIQGATAVANCTNNELKVIERAILGHVVSELCGEDYSYEKYETATYINSATSINNATYVLDQSIANLSAFTETVNDNTNSLSGDVNCLKTELNVTQENVLGVSVPECGLKGDGNIYQYVPNNATNYINSATTFFNADEILDAQIKKTNDYVEVVENNLYSLSAEHLTLIEEVDKIETGAGLDPDGGYVVPNGCIISAATSLYNADQLLDNAICQLREALGNVMVGKDTTSVRMGIDTVGANNYIKAEVKLSHGNTGQMTEDELTITDFTGTTIEEGKTEFTDSNALRIVKITTDDNGNEYNPNISANGVFLSTEWNCGEYTENGEGTFNNKYSIDDASTASGYDYSNNVR